MSKSILTEPDRTLLLQKQLERERKARQEAEAIAEKITRELYERQRELILLQQIAEASNEAARIEDAMQIALDQICGYTGWPVGHVYLSNPEVAGELVPTTLWHIDASGRFEAFRKVTEETRFPSGVGLPGRVTASGKAVWSNDVTQDDNFPRRHAAKDIGVKAGFAFPVPVGKETAAVMEFFSDQILEPDAKLLEIMMRIGLQLGRVIERQRAAEALKNSEQEFRRIWEDSLDGMRLTDEEGTVLLVNSAFCRLVGKPAEEINGKPFSVIYEEKHQHSSLAKHKERFAARDVQPVFEREMLLWHGGKIWFELSNSFLEIKGQPTCLLSIFRDVTERKIAEEKLQDFTGRLGRSNRELQDFAYVASHDLQEPLRKVAVFSDRLKIKFGSVLGEEGVDYVTRMQKATERMQNLITDLLSFSRVTSKSQPFVPVDLSEIVTGVLADLETRIEQVGGKVEVGSLRTIEAEPLQMRQLFQNLIGNALKFYRPEEKPVVRVESTILRDKVRWLEIDGTPRDMLRLTVKDNGIGFDEKYTEKIFQVFQRLHGREAYEGTGMGLAITRKIVEHHGGEITARSKPGEGTTFIVILPVKQKGAKNE